MDKNNDILQQAIDDRIDAFIRGMMTEEEEAAFKQEIQADPDLRAHVLATVSLIKGIRSQGALKEKDIIRKNAYNKQTIRYDMIRMFIDILDSIEDPTVLTMGQNITLNTLKAYELIKDINEESNE